MSITDGEDILASDFINRSQANATPANDAGRVSKLEGDGKTHPYFTRNGWTPNAGATINGATLPVPVYQDKSDNEVYACDGNDLTKLKFLGFAISNGTNGNPIQVQTNGIVPGFTGLNEGQKYYLSDTAGTISDSPGTYEVLVGIAVSQTELLILRGKRYASGSLTRTGDGTTTITTGFRVSKVTVRCVQDTGSQMMRSFGVWTVFGGNRGYADEGGTLNTSTSHSFTVNTSNMNGAVDSITDTTFGLTVSGSPAGTTNVFWEAEGEL